MTDMISWITTHLSEIVAILTGAVTVASAIAALTPTPKDDNVVGKVYKVVDWLALNVGKAKNKPGE
tara:strand:+ start:1009 stop:1206 length:198 start_codon:yes stop_codon:yes gene_type:complete